MSDALSGRVALVTGASRGIGASAALALAKAGAHVVAVARNAGGLAALHREIDAAGGTATVMPLDMTSGAAIATLAETIGASFGRLDILVANAGILGIGAPVDRIEPAVWDEIIAVNLTSNLTLIRAMHPLLKKSDAARALFITSGISWRGLPELGAYAASKAALNALVQSYAAENKDSTMRINLFSPGATRTELYSVAFPATDPNTLATPEGVAEKIVEACLPGVTHNGRVYDFRRGQWLSLTPPA